MRIVYLQQVVDGLRPVVLLRHPVSSISLKALSDLCVLQVISPVNRKTGKYELFPVLAIDDGG